MLKEYIIEKLHIGIIYNKSSEWWNIPQLIKKLSKFENLKITTLEASDLNQNKNKIPCDLEALTLLPSEASLIPSIMNNNNNNTKIKWIHSMFAGVDKFINLKEIKENENLTLTNSKGAFADSLSEFALLSMLYFSYNCPAYAAAYKERKWIRPINSMLKDKTLLIIGYGLNGVNLAQKAKSGFGLKVCAMRKNINNLYGAEHLEALLPISDFDKAISDADFLVSFLPQTQETVNFFNLEKLEKMKNTSVFINLGRGSAVVESDLVKLLKEKRIKGAVLDVTQMEPLPVDSELYELDNVFLSCHSADNTEEYFNQALEVFEKNIDLLFKEGKFYSEVDKMKGY